MANHTITMSNTEVFTHAQKTSPRNYHAVESMFLRNPKLSVWRSRVQNVSAGAVESSKGEGIVKCYNDLRIIGDNAQHKSSFA